MFEERLGEVNLQKPILFQSFTDKNTKLIKMIQMIGNQK